MARQWALMVRTCPGCGSRDGGISCCHIYGCGRGSVCCDVCGCGGDDVYMVVGVMLLVVVDVMVDMAERVVVMVLSAVPGS